MKKKLLSFACICAIAAGILAGCSGKGGENPTQPAKPSESTETVTSSSETNETGRTTEANQTEESTEETTTEYTPAEDETRMNDTYNIAETVLYEENGITITALGLSYDSYYVNLSLRLTNETDGAVKFLAGTLGCPVLSVNGYTVAGAYLNQDVAAGESVEKTVTIMLDELSILGIHEIADIQIGFELDYENGAEVFTGPKKVTTSLAGSYDYETDSFLNAINDVSVRAIYGYEIIDSSDAELLNAKGIRIISSSIVKNKKGQQIAFFELENDTDEPIYVGFWKMAINGLTLYSGKWNSNYLLPGTRCVASVDLYRLTEEECYETLGIDLDNIGEISFAVSAYTDQSVDIIKKDETVVKTVRPEAGSYEISGTPVYDANGISIYAIGILDRDDENYKDVYSCFVVVNNSTDTISIVNDYEDATINEDTTMSHTFYTIEVEPGAMGVLVDTLSYRDLEDEGLTGSEAISSITFGFEIRGSNYKVIDEGTLCITK